MNLGIKHISFLLFALLFVQPEVLSSQGTDKILKDASIRNGFVPAEEVNPVVNEELVQIGKTFFNSKNVSLNGDISCQTCHIDKFGSADGIPNGVGVGGVGEGMERVQKGGAILPRNTLPLWGRGSDNFNVLFWDGKVEKVKEYILSQFGENFPSTDPIVIAAHLPPVEIREMLVEDKFITDQKQEMLTTAKEVYEKITAKVIDTEPDAVEKLAKFYSMDIQDLTYLQIAEAIAEFIRAKFAVQNTKFHSFVFENGELSEKEKLGAMLFYGKGKCSACHSGALMSDLSFHAVPFPQLGYGRNGFGIDYGRYNSTHNPNDLYKFRTPPLMDVENTFPYSHSGAVDSLEEAIIYHFDPLRFINLEEMSSLDRHEYFKRLGTSSSSMLTSVNLSDEEVAQVIAFLKTLSFSPEDI